MEQFSIYTSLRVLFVFWRQVFYQICVFSPSCGLTFHFLKGIFFFIVKSFIVTALDI